MDPGKRHGSGIVAGLSTIWLRHLESYDERDVAGSTRPLTLLLIAIIAIAGLATMHFVPQAREFTGFYDFWPTFTLMCSALAASAALGASMSRPNLRGALTVLDSTLYCLAMIALMSATKPDFRYVAGMLYALMALDYGRRHSFAIPMFVAVVVVPAGASFNMLPDWGAIAIVLFGAVLFIVTAFATGRQREARRQKDRLQSALGVTSEVAARSMDIAIASTVADLGRALHDMRNTLTPVAGNLRYVAAESSLSDEPSEALGDALRGVDRTVALVEDLLRTMKSRSVVSEEVFSLDRALLGRFDYLREAIRRRTAVTISGDLPPFDVKGNPEHVLSVVENLVRNASEAGARSVTISVALDGSTESAIVSVADDGPGIPESIRSGLLEFPTSHGKYGTHGFGLYISRRLLELTGGKLDLAGTGPGRTIFVMHIPGKYRWDDPGAADPGAPSSGPAGTAAGGGA